MQSRKIVCAEGVALTLSLPVQICDRPFTVYRWQPGPKARFKKTELCHTCAKVKNVCQTCVLDLQYGTHSTRATIPLISLCCGSGLPVEVRDSTLEEHEKMKMPVSDTNKEYQIEQLERDMVRCVVSTPPLVARC